MVTTPEAVVATQEEAKSQTEGQAEGQEEAPATEPQQTAEELLAELKAEKAEKQKLIHQLKSVQGSSKAALDQMADLKALRREMAAMSQVVRVLAKGQNTPEAAEAAQADIERITQATQQQEAQAVYQQQADEFYTDLMEEVEDSGLAATAPEWVEVVADWNEGLQSRNLRQMAQAARAAKEIRREAQRKGFETSEAEKKKKSGALNTPVIKATGGGGAKTLEELARVDTRRFTPSELRAHDKVLTSAMTGRK